ncbi:MAG: hypothetical protein K2Q26_01705 [Bdellovibrionales bacterium]|nr:hypothetical protein [Bdellovibrionales bacterium]
MALKLFLRWSCVPALFLVACTSTNLSQKRYCPGQLENNRCIQIINLDDGENSTTQFTSTQKQQLNLAIKFLKANKDLHANIDAHTFSVNSRKLEKSKTDQMLDTLDEYLKSQNIDVARFHMSSYGAQDPRFEPSELTVNHRLEISYYTPQPETPIE